MGARFSRFFFANKLRPKCCNVIEVASGRSFCGKGHLHRRFFCYECVVGCFKVLFSFESLSMKNGKAELKVSDLTVIVGIFCFELGIFLSDCFKLGLLGCLVACGFVKICLLALVW